MNTVILHRFKIRIIVASLLVCASLCIYLLLPFSLNRITGHKDEIITFDSRIYHSNIYMLETSGSSQLRPRQACAVESVVRHHYKSKVIVLLFTDKPVEDVFSLSESAHNIAITTMTFEDVFKDTPLWNWYQKGEWRGSTYKVYDLSDASRLCLIWKHGGIYLDLDMVVQYSLYGVQNFLVREHDEVVTNSIFGFKRHHRFLSVCLKHFKRKYEKGVWGSGGPTLLTNIHESLCAFSMFGGRNPACNLTVLSPKVAFPILWDTWNDYFDKRRTSDVLRKISNSNVIHMWSSLSRKKMISINSGSAYERMMQINCPIVYGHLVELSILNSSFVF